MPALTREASSKRPAGPTKGFPLRSSSLPGCSPTNMMRAWDLPSPKTVCVAFFQSGQFLQTRASSANSWMDLETRFACGLAEGFGKVVLNYLSDRKFISIERNSRKEKQPT